MLIECLHALIASLLQQLVHQGQQLAVDLFFILVGFEALLHLVPHLMPYLFRVTTKHGADRSTYAANELRWLPRGDRLAARHHETTQHTNENDAKTYLFLHERSRRIQGAPPQVVKH